MAELYIASRGSFPLYHKYTAILFWPGIVLALTLAVAGSIKFRIVTQAVNSP